MACHRTPSLSAGLRGHTGEQGDGKGSRGLLGGIEPDKNDHSATQESYIPPSFLPLGHSRLSVEIVLLPRSPQGKCEHCSDNLNASSIHSLPILATLVHRAPAVLSEGQILGLLQ